ncbi:MAG: endolytic transglycosylase MltG [Rhodospirillaceae bacterium]
MPLLRRLGVAAVALIALAALAGTAAYVKGREAFFAPGPSASATTVVVPKGAGVERIAHMLAEAGTIDDPRLFRIGVRLSGRQAALRAGEYAFPPGVSMQGILDMLAAGAVVQRRLTIPEGLTVKQALALIAAAPGLEGAVPETLPEGSLLPETHAYTLGESRAALLKRMAAAMDRALASAWEGRAPDLPLRSPEEALILASIVERETGVPGERPQVAAVFLNRLKLGMRLQSDPTVIYGLSAGAGTLERGLTRGDLDSETPFNTYVIDRLPPTPICLPGAAALAAVTHPADTTDLYFVADGSGGHVFSKTLAEHTRNVAKWRAIQKAAKKAGKN